MEFPKGPCQKRPDQNQAQEYLALYNRDNNENGPYATIQNGPHETKVKLGHPQDGRLEAI